MRKDRDTIEYKKYRSRKLVAKALKDGILKKPKKCLDCKKSTFLEGHHKDYLKPLEVLWLCNSCHKKADIRDGTNGLVIYRKKLAERKNLLTKRT